MVDGHHDELTTVDDDKAENASFFIKRYIPAPFLKALFTLCLRADRASYSILSLNEIQSELVNKVDLWFLRALTTLCFMAFMALGRKLNEPLLPPERNLGAEKSK